MYIICCKTNILTTYIIKLRKMILVFTQSWSKKDLVLVLFYIYAKWELDLNLNKFEKHCNICTLLTAQNQLLEYDDNLLYN